MPAVRQRHDALRCNSSCKYHDGSGGGAIHTNIESHSGTHYPVGVTLFQERNLLGAPRLQLSGRAIGSHTPTIPQFTTYIHYMCETQ